MKSGKSQAIPPGFHELESFTSTSEAETLNWASAFAVGLVPGDNLALSGELGAGKTRLAQAFAKALGFEGDTHSPSYALILEYDAPTPLFHVDLYRLSEGADWEEIGLEYYAERGGIMLMEWPERLGKTHFPFSYWLRLDITGETSRLITVFRAGL